MILFNYNGPKSCGFLVKKDQGASKESSKGSEKEHKNLSKEGCDTQAKNSFSNSSRFSPKKDDGEKETTLFEKNQKLKQNYPINQIYAPHHLNDSITSTHFTINKSQNGQCESIENRQFDDKSSRKNQCGDLIDKSHCVDDNFMVSNYHRSNYQDYYFRGAQQFIPIYNNQNMQYRMNNLVYPLYRPGNSNYYQPPFVNSYEYNRDYDDKRQAPNEYYDSYPKNQDNYQSQDCSNLIKPTAGEIKQVKVEQKPKEIKITKKPEVVSKVVEEPKKILDRPQKFEQDIKPTPALDQDDKTEKNSKKKKKKKKIVDSGTVITYELLQSKEIDIVSSAKDQNRCREIQNIIDSNSSQIINSVLSEISDNLDELVLDQFGNYLIQKLFDYLSDDSLDQIYTKLQPRFLEYSLSLYGTRVIQKLMDKVTPKRNVQLFALLAPHSLKLIIDFNGTHVFYKSFSMIVSIENGTDAKLQSLLKEHSLKSKNVYDLIINNLEEICYDKQGCCFIQKCLELADESARLKIFDLVISYSCKFVDHIYANYVIQYIISKEIQYYNNILLSLIQKDIIKFSNNKSSSNIIEKLFTHYSQKHADLIDHVLSIPNGIQSIILNEYGNYVYRCMLDHSIDNKELYNRLLKEASLSVDGLLNCAFGTKFIKKLIETHPTFKQYLDAEVLLNVILNNKKEEAQIEQPKESHKKVSSKK